jgi:NADH-quinone oxidoreductase subunit C
VNAEELASKLESHLPDAIVARGEVTTLAAADKLIAALEMLRDDPEFAFDTLSDIAATDWPDRDPRFWVAYELYSMRHRHRLRVKVGLPESRPHIPTVTELYPTANWLEREVYDLFGLFFDGHPNMTRILLPNDWEGHPQRKTEDLGGVNTPYKNGKFIPPIDQRLSSR